MFIIQKDTCQLMKQIALSSVKFCFAVVGGLLFLWGTDIWVAALAFFFFLNERDNHLKERKAFFRDLGIPKTDKQIMRGMRLVFVVVWSVIFYGGYKCVLLLVERFPILREWGGI